MNNPRNFFEDKKSKYGEVFEESIRNLFLASQQCKEFVSEFFFDRCFIVSRIHSILEDDYFSYLNKKSFKDYIHEPVSIKTNKGYVRISASYKQKYKCYNFIIEGEKIIVKNSLWNIEIKNIYFSFDA